MRLSRPRAKPVFTTLGDIQRGAHYATHVRDHPISRRPLVLVDDAHMDDLLRCEDPDKCRGIPTTFNYAHGILRVWPWPAKGWQVWSEVSGKDVTP